MEGNGVGIGGREGGKGMRGRDGNGDGGGGRELIVGEFGVGG